MIFQPWTVTGKAVSRTGLEFCYRLLIMARRRNEHMSFLVSQFFWPVPVLALYIATLCDYVVIRPISVVFHLVENYYRRLYYVSRLFEMHSVLFSCRHSSHTFCHRTRTFHFTVWPTSPLCITQ